MGEDTHWAKLQIRRGASWVEKRKKAMTAARKWREEIISTQRRDVANAEMARLDAIVEADYQTRQEKRRAREERRRLKTVTHSS